ncbi:MAG: hypothetical protein ACI38U_02150 [Corynebacterium sp.]|uniref:hypothetical protein n=1 Tax=Corynebacterium sp. TaxID=1720 RepID=UPI003F0241E3
MGTQVEKVETSLTEAVRSEVNRTEFIEKLGTELSRKIHVSGSGGGEADDKLRDVRVREQDLRKREKALDTKFSPLYVLQSLGAALVPLAVTLVAVAVILGVVQQVLGVGPITSYIWDSFEAAGTWWTKTLIGVTGLLVGGGGLVATWAGAVWVWGKLDEDMKKFRK